ncbi:hypothetical protein [Serratia fonticola]|nr:hypothetical protein [Serratia fonticola]
MKVNDKMGMDEEVKPGYAPHWGIASPQHGSDRKKPANHLAGFL